MSRHPGVRRSPTKNTDFSWGRFPMGPSGIVVHRLFRRDHAGALHFIGLNFYRRDIAIALRAACHRLRDQVDEIDMARLGGGGVKLGETPVVFSIDPHKASESIRVLDAEIFEELEMFLKKLEVVRPALIDLRIPLSDVLAVVRSDASMHSVGHVLKRAAVADQCCQVRAKAVWQVVNSVQHAFRFWKHRELRVSENFFETIWIIDLDLPVLDRYRSRYLRQNRVQASGKAGYFMQQQTPQDFGVRFLQGNDLIALLFGYGLCVLCNFSSARRGSVSHSRNPDGACGCTQAYDDRRPVSPIAPRRLKRTELNRHNSSLLEPILP